MKEDRRLKIAIVEDDTSMRKGLEAFLSDYKEFEIVGFVSGKKALEKLDHSYFLIITDINMPNINGLDFLKEAKKICHPHIQSIVITGNATLNYAVEALRLGAIDFLMKPFKPEDLLNSINRAKEIMEFKSINKPMAIENREQNTPFVGQSGALDEVIKIANKVALTDASVLLLGESGVGKEVFAKYIHSRSNRKTSPFVAINMAALPEHLIESELFGYEKGAFTDATAQKIGLFEAANNGTIFLDEIGEMPINLQAKLLRVLQEKEITRLGSTKNIKIDVRFISATNANLTQKIFHKEFREDLYFRLRTIPILIPPLRHRSEEIADIALDALAKIIKTYNLPPKSFDDLALKKLKLYNWPGNIRELLSVVEQAAILSDEVIMEKDLFLDVRGASDIVGLEKELLMALNLDKNGDLKSISNELGMDIDTLKQKMQFYKIGDFDV